MFCCLICDHFLILSGMHFKHVLYMLCQQMAAESSFDLFIFLFSGCHFFDLLNFSTFHVFVVIL